MFFPVPFGTASVTSGDSQGYRYLSSYTAKFCYMACTVHIKVRMYECSKLKETWVRKTGQERLWKKRKKMKKKETDLEKGGQNSK